MHTYNVLLLLLLLFFTSCSSNEINRFNSNILDNSNGQEIKESIILSDFERDGVIIINPNQPQDQHKYLFNIYPNSSKSIGKTELSSSYSVSGDKSLKAIMTRGPLYLQMYNYSQTDYVWHWTRQHIDEGQEWKENTYNRLRFWIKLPEGIERKITGQPNLHFGTYFRARNGNPSSAESGGGHYYHYFNLESAGGNWQQVIIDFHPTHNRDDNGNIEQGVKEYPTNEQGFNYFDAFTRFYIWGDFVTNSSAFYFDRFEFYRDENDENIEQICTLTGTYNNINNEFILGWSRDKNEGQLEFEVHYAFDDIHENGWQSSIPAPDGVVSSWNEYSYNILGYNTSDIDLENHTQIYFAIKPKNSNRFRQIIIPIN
ncbi:hypothetical protein Q4Q35_10735 [Flavivirga aquimarina]|uniref:Uncharacterized protein n=1 Tax=Flavivirga aquimarina TaxID=2027862 RepID=A0ABT8WAV5_9FLAO|nr:hypothetical protein [Flavivirga aquimarina]MDO5970281.1 hypothetical protein [Flavivirga aquimarina]